MVNWGAQSGRAFNGVLSTLIKPFWRKKETGKEATKKTTIRWQASHLLDRTVGEEKTENQEKKKSDTMASFTLAQLTCFRASPPDMLAD